MIRRIAGIGLGTSAFFLAVVAVMLNSPSLFYMGTALLAMIGASRLQAYLSVRGLRFERITPESVSVGEPVRVEITVWSLTRIRRPLLTIRDALPPKLPYRDRSLSMPIAPSVEAPVRTHYSFVPLKRGKYRWSGIRVVGTDALGIVSVDKEYRTESTQLTVLPQAIPVQVELPTAAGWGISEAESGQSRGAGLEPRGIREYQSGDSLRHVHWRSSARAGQLLVKEFEAGSHATVAFVLQMTSGTEVGSGAETSFELMCGHLMFLAGRFLRQGARVELPQFYLASSRGSVDERLALIAEALAGAKVESNHNLAADIYDILGRLVPGSAVFVMHAVADESLLSISGLGAAQVKIVPLVYDAEHFGEKNLRVRSAAEGRYLSALETSGMTPVLMPAYGEIG